jgi:hypothetical protein
MRNVLPLCAILFVVGAANAQNPKPEYSESLHYSCLYSPFLSISAHSRRHDNFPAVELRLIDPLQRHAGDIVDAPQIPKSHYGKIVEIPRRPEISKAVAIEICDATPGQYLITVSEHVRTEYVISVTGDGETQNLYIRNPEESRTCRYRFYFSIADGKAAIRWLDHSNHPMRFAQQPDCDSVLRAAIAIPGTHHLNFGQQ